jgi:TRAP-type C4-dicarboxylate transport system substrate-binding protein
MVAILTLLAAFVAAPGAAVTATAPEPVTIEVGAGFPRGFRSYEVLADAARAVTAASEGRLEVKLAPEVALGSDDLSRVLAGDIAGALIPTVLLAGSSPTAAALAAPLAVESFDEAEFVAARLGGAIAQELAPAGLVDLGGANMGFAYLLSRSPVATPKDLSGRRLWMPRREGSGSDSAIFGAVEVSLGLDEVEGALARDAQEQDSVDCVISLPDLAIAKKWHRHLGAHLDLPLFLVDFRLVFGAKALDALDASDRAAIEREFLAALRRIDADRKARFAAFRRVFERSGMQIVVPDVEQRAAWMKWREEVLGKLVEGGRIVAPSREALEAARDEFRREHGAAGESRDQR